MDFATEGARIGVKASVLRLLSEMVPFKEANEWISKSKDNEEFWERVDSMPPQISLALHKEELLMDEGKDFPKGSIEPDIFNYFQANCISSGVEPLLANTTSISLSSNAIIESILEADGWKNVEENVFSFGDFSCEIDALRVMCDSFISGASTWKVCPFDGIRIEYTKIEEFLQKIDPRILPALNNVFSKLQNFSYHNSDEFIEDASFVVEEDALKEFETFEIDDKIVDELAHLMNAVTEAVLANPECAEHCAIDDATMLKTENLVMQMQMPFPQRTAFALTPRMISERTGANEDGEEGFEQGSLAQLLFCDNAGNPMPMPYQSRSIELPASSMHGCCSAAIRKYVALVLSENSFKAAPTSVLDVLTDYTEEMIKTIAQFTKGKRKAFKTETEALNSTMLEIGVITKPSLQ